MRQAVEEAADGFFLVGFSGQPPARAPSTRAFAKGEGELVLPVVVEAEKDSVGVGRFREGIPAGLSRDHLDGKGRELGQPRALFLSPVHNPHTSHR